MFDSLLSVIAPHSCCGCGNLGDLLCDICKNDIVSEPFSCCIVCRMPTSDNNICLTCSRKSGIGAAWCVSSRDIVLKQLLDRYKFDSAKEAAKVCAYLLHERLPVLPQDITITSVPTSSPHVRVRGYDHMALVTKKLARRRDLSYDQFLSKEDNGTQHFRSRAERFRHAQDGLRLIRKPPEAIFLIDDIYTTGATLHACVKVLRKAGAKRVYVGIIAKQTLDDRDDL